MTCTETYTQFGDVITCDVEGDHDVLRFPEAHLQHWAWWVNPEGVHPDVDAPSGPCMCARNPDCRGTVGPLDVRIGWGTPVEEETP